MNWDVEILSSGETEDLSDVIEQFEAATLVREQFHATNGASGLCVVSMTASWGVENAGTCNGFMEPLFTDMTAAGILLVASGPNDPVSIESGTDFPANCALAEHLLVTSYGPNNETPFAFGPNTVHLLAPGVVIPVATVASTYAVVDGNSFAIPTVAGAIALLYSIPCPSFAQLVMDDPQAAREQVKNAVLNNTAPFPGGSTLTITGGKLDVHAADQALMTACVPTCSDYTITLTTIDESVASWTIRDVDDAEVLTGSGNAIASCVDDGCFSITLNGSNGLPMEADYIVEDANGEVAMGNSFGGIIQFGVGVQIPGCTNPNSANYDPQANCNDGSCCSGDLVQVVVLPADLETEGTVDMVVTSNGNTLFNGPIDIAFDPEFSLPVGTWEGCVTEGCFSVQVSNATMPLGNAGYIILDNDIANPEPFNTANGYYGVSGGTAQPEICVGQDNDCALVVTYQNLTSGSRRRVIVRDGLISTTAVNEVVSDSFTGVAAPFATTGRFHTIVGDAQLATTSPLTFNGTTIGTGSFNNTDGPLWDAVRFIVSVAATTANQIIYSYPNIKRVYTQGLEANLSYPLSQRISMSLGYQLLYAKDADVADAVERGEVYWRDPETLVTRRQQPDEYFGLYNRSRDQKCRAIHQNLL